jgi:hypothetical protein
MVDGRENDVRKILRHRHHAFPDLVEQRFDVMREGCDGVEAEHRSGAFDSVKGAEHLVHRFAAIAIVGHGERGRFDFREQILGFLKIGINRFAWRSPSGASKESPRAAAASATAGELPVIRRAPSLRPASNTRNAAVSQASIPLRFTSIAGWWMMQSKRAWRSEPAASISSVPKTWRTPDALSSFKVITLAAR